MARAKGGRAGIEVEGGPQLRRAFAKLEDRADDLRDAHRSAAETVEDEAESIAPRLTGALIDSIRTSVRKTGSSVLAGGTGLVPYAGPIHFGWRARNIEPQPFLYDALDRRRGEIAERYAAEVGTMVRRFDAEAPR
jgi:hypothetical protein